MTDDVVVSTIEGAVGLITINRADKFNCLSMAVHQGLQDALKTHEANANIRVILLCSEGAHFCTGADLGEVQDKVASKDEQALKVFIELGHKTCVGFEKAVCPLLALYKAFV